MNLHRFLLALAALAAFTPLRAETRTLESGADYITSQTPIPGTLRFELAVAQTGDVIVVPRNMVVHLNNPITIQPGQNNLTITGADPVPGLEDSFPQIRSKIVRGDQQSAENLTVLGNNVLIKRLSFRDTLLSIGSTALGAPAIQKGTVRDCVFNQEGNLDFVDVTDGLVQDCKFTVTNRTSGAVIEAFRGAGVHIIHNTIDTLGTKATDTGISIQHTVDMLVENNTLDCDLYFVPASGVAKDNILKNRFLSSDVLVNDDSQGITLEHNTCGALRARGLNFTIRRNIISGVIKGRGNPKYKREATDEEKDVFIPLAIEGARAASSSKNGSFLVEHNEVEGGKIGVLLNLEPPVTQAKFFHNTIKGADLEGMVVNSVSSPVEISENTFEACGKTVDFGPPFPALHLFKITTPDITVLKNKFLKSQGAGITVSQGAPVLDTNEFSRGKAVGIYVRAAATPIFAGVNKIELMGHGGIRIERDATVSVDDVVFTSNLGPGILVDPGGKLTASHCTFNLGLAQGVKFADTKGGVIARGLLENCTVTRNFGAGVLIGKGALVEIAAGSFFGNRGAGIDIAPGGITANTKPKQGNGDLDFPEQLTFDNATRSIRGQAEPGSIVQLYRTESLPRIGNPKNGEGKTFIGEVTATIDGDFAVTPGPSQEGDLFCLTATRLGPPAVTSEFSANLAVPPSSPTDIVSVSSNEEFANAASRVNEWNLGPLQPIMANRSISANGRFALFHSDATNLVSNDTNNAGDLFVRDRVNGTTERVNVDSSGNQSGINAIGDPGKNGHGAISADGRWVVFCSAATNLVSGDENTVEDIFLHDRETGATIAVTDPTEQPDMTFKRGGVDCSISADGNVVAFVTQGNSHAPVGPGDYHILAWTRSTGQFDEVSVGQPVGTTASPACPRLSADGRFVAFHTFARMVASDTDNIPDVYVRDRQNGTTERVSIATNGTPIPGGVPSISDDGRYIAYLSFFAGDPADTNGEPDAYVRDRQAGTLTWASQPPVGGFPEPNFGPGCGLPCISGDGRYVAFEGPGNTSRPDSLTELITDLFVRDLQRGITVEVSLGDDGDARGACGFPVLSADGRFVLFGTIAFNLAEGDNNHLADIFVRDITKDFPEE
jgi:Tol biopolymer transport system component